MKNNLDLWRKKEIHSVTSGKTDTNRHKYRIGELQKDKIKEMKKESRKAN